MRAMNLHEKYFDSVAHFSMDRKMENIPTSEVLVASLMRQLGLSLNSAEAKVWKDEDLYGFLFDESRKDIIEDVCRKELATPLSKKIYRQKLQGQEQVAFREDIKAYTPELASHIHGSRNKGKKKTSSSPWNPGMWFIEEIALGFEHERELIEFLHDLGEALEVGSFQDKEDPLARYISLSLKEESRSLKNHAWREQLENIPFHSKSRKRREVYGWKKLPLHTEFVGVFKFLIEVKQRYTRYQWLQMVDSVLRLFATMTTLYRLSSPKAFVDSVKKNSKPSSVFNHRTVVSYGQNRKEIIEAGIQEYIIHYLMIGLLIQDLELHEIQDSSTSDLCKEILSRSLDVEVYRERAWTIVRKDFEREFQLKVSSSLKNTKEFLEYVGIKKEDASSQAVDFSFHYEKKGRGYRFIFGDALLYLLANYVGAKLNSKTYSSQDFNDALAKLGIDLKMSEYSLRGLKNRLLALGLVEESSDSDAGLLFRLI